MLLNIKQGQIGSVLRKVVSASGADSLSLSEGGVLRLTGSTAYDVTLRRPRVGAELIVVNRGSAAITVTFPSGFTWDGTNRRASLPANAVIYAVAESDARMIVISTVGSITYSNPS